MQLDFQQFLIKLERLTGLRSVWIIHFWYYCIYYYGCIHAVVSPFSPIPFREFVESYVKAYYFPEAQLESWIKDHKVRTCLYTVFEFTPRVLICYFLSILPRNTLQNSWFHLFPVFPNSIRNLVRGSLVSLKNQTRPGDDWVPNVGINLEAHWWIDDQGDCICPILLHFLLMQACSWECR